MKKYLSFKIKLHIIWSILRTPVWAILLIRFKPVEGDTLTVGDLTATWKKVE